MKALKICGKATLLLAAAALMSLAGCATDRYAVEKAGGETSEIQRDRSACLRASINTERGDVLTPYAVDRDVYARCMEARGYPITIR